MPNGIWFGMQAPTITTPTITYTAEFLLNNSVVNTGTNGVPATNVWVTFANTNFDTQAYSGVFGWSAYVSINTSSSFSFTTPFFVEAQIKTTSTWAERDITWNCHHWDGSRWMHGYQLWMSPTWKLLLTLWAGRSGWVKWVDYQQAAWATSINDGNWHTVRWEWTGMDIRVYVDWVLDWTSPTWTTTPAYVYNGQITYPRIWVRQFSANYTNYFIGNIQKSRYWLYTPTDS